MQDEKTDSGIEIPAPPRAAIRMPDLGALSTFMKDPTITEIMVNDVRNVMIEKEGKSLFSGLALKSADELNRLLQTVLTACGRTLDPDQPYLDASLPDGSRVNIVAPPLTLGGPCITIRKFPAHRFSLEDLVKLEMMDLRIGQFLKACVMGKMNV